jgi:hypothetical protein
LSQIDWRRPSEVLPKRNAGSRIAVVALGAAMLVAGACGPDTRTATRTLLPFMRAVQEREIDALYCMFAGASEAEELGTDRASRLAGFEEWIVPQYEAYLEGRDRGWVDPDDSGVALVKLFALGKGTYFTYGPAEILGDDAIAVRIDLRFAYSHVDLSRLSPGTTFYVAGEPVGRVSAIRIPHGRAEVDATVLKTIGTRWTLVNRAETEDCPAGWKIASVEPIEGTAVTETVTWVF